MPDVKISQLPAGNANANAVVPATNAAGTTTQKVTLGSIVGLAHQHTISQVTDLETTLGQKLDVPESATAGDVLTYSDGSWVAAAPSGGGGGGDYLPLAGGTMTGNIVFDGTSGQYVGKGSFDTSRGGNYGLSLVCSVGYELNWQAGYLIATEQDHVTPRPLYLDSGSGTTMRAWADNGGSPVWTEISHTGITFPDGSAQSTAGIPALSFVPNGGDVLTWDNGAGAWTAAAPAGGGIPAPSSPNGGDILSYDSAAMAWIASAPTWGIPSPNSINDGDVLTYSVASSAWIAAAPAGIPAPGSPSTNDVLSWNGSSWVAVAPTTPGLPSGTQGQYLKYDGTNWVSASVFPSASAGQYLQYDGTNWAATSMTIADYNPSAGYNTGDIVAYGNTIWRATSTGMGNAPAYGSMYWLNLSILDNNPIPSPSMPSDGNVLTYSSIANAWVASAPAGGATYLHSRLTTDETASSALALSSLSLSSIAGSATYLVEGLAIMEGDQAQAIQLALSAYDSDGDVHLDHDYAVAVDLSEWMVVHNLDQTSFSQCVNADTWSGTFTAPVRFRALVVTGAISSTSLNLYFGPSSLSGSTYLKAGSWITATKVA